MIASVHFPSPSLSKAELPFGWLKYSAWKWFYQARMLQNIAAEVLQHLTSLLDCKVEVTLEIHVHYADGFPEDLQRILKENCATLKFEKEADFEAE